MSALVYVQGVFLKVLLKVLSNPFPLYSGASERVRLLRAAVKTFLETHTLGSIVEFLYSASLQPNFDRELVNITADHIFTLLRTQERIEGVRMSGDFKQDLQRCMAFLPKDEEYEPLLRLLSNEVLRLISEEARKCNK